MLPSAAPMPPLRRDRVRAGREHLAQHRDLQSRLGELERGAQPRTAGTDDDRIELSDHERHASGPPEDLDRPAGAADECEDDEHLERQA